MRKNTVIVLLIAIIIGLGVYTVHLKTSYTNFISQAQKQDAAFLQRATDECTVVDTKEYQLGSNGCYIEHALEFGSTAICDKITDNLRYDCYRQIASIKNNSSICRAINSSPQVTADDHSNISASTEKDACYSDLAILNKNQAMCDSVISADTRTQCQSCASGKTEGGLCYPLNILPAHL